ncbi:hypothetical protein BCR43DRAFT_492610 [Syncephalastrum racemosum]|uniref:Uncharacterized protein n=1 Tax=Syncephalastrum racemosum TaxID=13706 RepID=A0A1X2H974_SYNRA|nr:hypothetical protein BCR43DRAFT_492610 [Syncephalastrum racemosum]
MRIVSYYIKVVSTSKAYEKTLQIKIKEKDDTKLYGKGTKGSSKSVSQCRNGMLQLGVFGGVLQWEPTETNY